MQINNYSQFVNNDECAYTCAEKLESNFLMFVFQFYCENRSPASALEQVLTDSHSPSLFRVNGVVVNLEEFSSAFNCSKGSKMNPDPRTFQKCSVF